MDEDENVVAPDSQEPAEPTTEDVVEPEEDLQALRDKAALADDLEAKNKQLFARAKQAEGFNLVNGEWVKAPKAPAPKPKREDDLSTKDILALSNSRISDDEDIDFLKDAAALKKTTVAAVTRDETVMTLLKDSQEKRQTAIASSTSPTRRTSTERKGSDILASAKADNMPAPGKDMRKMVRASIGLPD